MKVTKMRGKSTYPMRATRFKSSSVDRIHSRGREMRLVEGRIDCRRLIKGGISRRRLVGDGIN
jgi:hypothetical protein